MTEEKPVTVRASKSGSVGKWLAGAAVVAVIAAGGYYAYKNFGLPQSNSSSVASNEQQFAQTTEPSVQAGPLPAQQNGGNVASPDEGASPASAAPQTQSASVTPAHRRAVHGGAVPEETIGVIPASASSEDSEAIIVQGARRPVWSHRPAAWRLAEAYPQRALEEGREGEASLQCTVVRSGALACEKVSEFPARAGFGGAALRVAQMYRHSQTLRDGSDAVGSPVNLHVVFRVDDNTRRG